MYRIHILILLKGSRIFLKSGYSLGNIPILLDYSLNVLMFLISLLIWKKMLKSVPFLQKIG